MSSHVIWLSTKLYPCGFSFVHFCFPSLNCWLWLSIPLFADCPSHCWLWCKAGTGFSQMLFWQQQRFAEYLLHQFRGKRPTGWSDLVTRFWTETGGANRKSFLPPKKASKLWRGAGKKKGQKKKNSRIQTVTVRHNLDLNRLNLQKALGFLAEFHKTGVQECIQKTARPPYWQITEPILESRSISRLRRIDCLHRTWMTCSKLSSS